MSIRISLVDNDYVVRTKTDLGGKIEDGNLGNFFREMEEELATGKTAHLEIEGLRENPVTFEISKFE